MKKIIFISLFTTLMATTALADCGWYFYVNNLTGQEVTIRIVDTKTLTWKAQWWGNQVIDVEVPSDGGAGLEKCVWISYPL